MFNNLTLMIRDEGDRLSFCPGKAAYTYVSTEIITMHWI